jgi:hypothetical protein
VVMRKRSRGDGRAIDLVMLMANRQQVVETISGPGVADVAT